ncbi:hypothetical protein [Polaromonas sp. LjRoot131]|uniref:hypothetical protein n=1 Tax=Polaromonas sp. LjRoot131 TaxID=3342262 RepID=UPI003ECE7187
MKRRALAAVLVTLLSACSAINWEQTAKESVKSACRGSSNCSIPCDRNNPATFNDPQCLTGGRRPSL